MTTDKRKISPDALERLRTTVIELFAEGLFHQIGMREIASRAGVGLQTIYKYFGNKDELIIAAIEQDLQQLTQLMKEAAERTKQQPAQQRFYAIGQEFFSFYLDNRHIAHIVFMNVPHKYWVTDPKFIQNEQLAITESIILNGQQQGQIRNDCDAGLLVQMVAGATNRFMVNILNSERMPQTGTAANELSASILWPMLKQ